jgi:hypothetical protein
VGKIGESGEYWMGRTVCGLDHKFRALKLVAQPESIKDRLYGPCEQVRLCTDAYEIYGVLQI